MRILVSLLLIITAQVASASFIEECEFDVKIQKLGDLTYPAPGRPHYRKVITGEVHSAKDTGGYTDCKSHIGKTYTMDVDFLSADFVLGVEKARSIIVDYFYSHSQKGEFRSYTHASSAQKAFKAAMQDALVFDAIVKLGLDLDSTIPEPVVLHSAKSTYIPEGLCGFVGCDLVYIVILTYGKEIPQSPKGTIMAKVVLPPHELEPTVTLIQ